MTYYLAIDIGASSGRHILACVEKGRLVFEEIYRFENRLLEQDGHLLWDTEALFSEVKAGIAQCKRLGKIPKSVGIDTWGVDYVLLDADKKPILPVYSYRDGRTEEAEALVSRILPQEALYPISGIQKQRFNTVYQLMADKESGRLAKARHFLMMPEYLSYLLCGVMANEYTNATTGGLIDAKTKTWSKTILDALGYPEEIFQTPSLPGTRLGRLTEEVRNEVGFDTEVILVPSHDTASAFAAIPGDDASVYISSGTWSLVGTENLEPILTENAAEANFTNEGGIDYRFRFLKNIMGAWLFQSIRRETGKRYSYDEMMHMAMESGYEKRFDPKSPSLLAPESMIHAIRTLLGEETLPLGDVLKSIYLSLAHSYRDTVEEIERICGKAIDSIYIVGGGSKDAYLNRLTAKITGRKVITGLTEATATGNLISQIMADEKLTLAEGRELIRTSFPIQEEEK